MYIYIYIYTHIHACANNNSINTNNNNNNSNNVNNNNNNNNDDDNNNHKAIVHAEGGHAQPGVQGVEPLALLLLCVNCVCVSLLYGIHVSLLLFVGG